MSKVNDAHKRPIDYLPYNVNKAISEAWLKFSLQNVLDELESWFNAALTNPLGCYKNAHERESFFIFYYELIRLIEATCFYDGILNRDRNVKQIKSSTKKEKKVYTEGNSPINFSFEQAENPLHIIKEFCSSFSAEWVRIELWNFFEAARSSDGYFSVDLTHITLLHLILSTLTEAAYVITASSGID